MKSGIYIHIPFCKSKCSYCDFASWAGCAQQDMRRYADAVMKEIELRKHSWAGHQFDTLFIGGGTPTLLPPLMLKDVLQAVHNSFHAELTEITIEANPGTVNRERLACYRALGINRISFGMQAAQDALLKRIGRTHTADDCARSAALALDAGIANISFDLMSGLPGQTQYMLLESVDFATSLSACHISLYTLKLEPGTRLGSDVADGMVTLPGEDQEWAMSTAARDRLRALGYERYEISNYAKKGFTCLHNLKYWTRAPYIGLGVAAASFDGAARTENASDLSTYINQIDSLRMPYKNSQLLSAADAAFEALMLALRLTCGLDTEDYYFKFGINLTHDFRDIIDRYKNHGCLNIKDGRIVLTDCGMDMQNRILVDFMEAWPNQR